MYVMSIPCFLAHRNLVDTGKNPMTASISGILTKAAVELMKTIVLELALVLNCSIEEVSGLGNMVGKAPEEA